MNYFMQASWAHLWTSSSLELRGIMSCFHLLFACRLIGLYLQMLKGFTTCCSVCSRFIIFYWWSCFAEKLLKQKQQGMLHARSTYHITLLILVPYDCSPALFPAPPQSCLLKSYPNNSCARVWMAPFSFLIDDYWVQSDGSSLLANTWEEATAKTAFLSDCSLNFRPMSCWQTETLRSDVLQCPLPSFLYSIPETLWNLQSQHYSLKKGNILLFFPHKCVQSLALCDSDLTLNGNSVVSFLSCHHLAAEQRVRPLSSG